MGRKVYVDINKVWGQRNKELNNMEEDVEEDVSHITYKIPSMEG